MRILKRDPILRLANDMVVDYPTASNISYLWNFGSLAGLVLVMQLVTGIFLSMHYTAHMDLAFASVEHIMRDVSSGWLLRYLHANGASFFFFLLYLHIFRGIYYGSYMYPRERTWHIGVVLYFLTMATGFLGYVLPWGQMSFWGATVITSMISAVPYIGDPIVTWLWGGFSLGNPSLVRFYSLHYLVPFCIAAGAGLHLVVLHIPKSNNPLGTNSLVDVVPFHPYLSLKDLFGAFVMLGILGYIVFFQPNMFAEADNYIPANPLVTPTHIVPEWYFLPFYAILRAIPSKLGGVIAMNFAIVILSVLPLVNTSFIRSGTFRPIFKKVYWVFVANVLILGWLGGIPPEPPFDFWGQVATGLYFGILLVVLPIVGVIENKLLLWQPSRESTK